MSAPKLMFSDVVIVGGGPVGLACAIALGQRDIDVMVVERSEWPVDKACGEGIMPSGIDVLRRLGVLDYLEPEQARAFRGVRWFSEDGQSAEADFLSGEGYGIRRTGLSTALYRRAQCFPYVNLSPLSQVVEMDRDESGARVLFKRDGELHEVRCRLIIAADGRRSFVRRTLELEGEPPVSARRWGTRRHFYVQPWSDQVEVYWSENLEAYVTPSSEGRVEIAFLWDADRYGPPEKGRKLFDGLLKQFPVLYERLKDAPTASRVATTGPLASQARRAVDDRCILVGDALGYVDGITGEGISAGLMQAEKLGRALPKLLRQRDLSREGLSPLGETLQETYLETIPMAKMALTLSRTAWLRRLVVRGLSVATPLFAHFLEANMGRTPLWRLPLSSIPAFLFGLVRPGTKALTSENVDEKGSERELYQETSSLGWNS